MRGFVTNKAGIVWIIGILILSMALFTNVDLTLAGDKKATSRLDGEGVKVADAETGFDGLEWLKLFKSNGWETKEYAGSVAARSGIDAVQWSPELNVLHQRFSEQARINELRDSRWKFLKSFRNSRNVSEISMREKTTRLDGANTAGATTILLNGTNPATINVGETVVVTISMDGEGARVYVFWGVLVKMFNCSMANFGACAALCDGLSKADKKVCVSACKPLKKEKLFYVSYLSKRDDVVWDFFGRLGKKAVFSVQCLDSLWYPTDMNYYFI